MDKYKCAVCYWNGYCEYCDASNEDCADFTPVDINEGDIVLIIENGRNEFRNEWWEYISDFE